MEGEHGINLFGPAPVEGYYEIGNEILGSITFLISRGTC
jgi:hypothetical protein